MSDNVVCLACGYAGSIDTFPAALSVYQDIRCPQCGSTNNEVNSDYQDRLFAKMRETNPQAKQNFLNAAAKQVTESSQPAE